MDNFFMRHSCGEICTALGLTRSPLQMGDADITEAGTVSHELRTVHSSDLDSSLSSVMSAPGALDRLLTRSLSSLRSDATPRSSGSLLCSGPLLCEARCGGAVEASGDKYLKHLRKYGGIYCESCKLQVKDSMCRAPCQRADCKEHVFYSVFVLGITGTAAPTSCRHCRALECWTLIERVDETDSVE
ncbi:unnamed protein product [Polarella glacialis]|uniref:Alpha-type protein kinase domain-containing protein n=2 Tax=Polarella glacialis TaxID=89957 RepID=A0A813FIE6_POLGL|nr:unnamed protein product [Polarella glacialis]